ncbi:MAG: phosphoserine phosphatase SerB [Burkholderiaceae bacterium]|nr:phosphoserine phosphatase SerB [Burkholderiaceae bacterium]
MPRFIVHAPDLTDASIEEFSRLARRRPDVRRDGMALWRDVVAPAEAVAETARRLEVDAQALVDERTLDDFKLLTFDMDSTLITIECVDEIADFVGRKAEVAAITEAAMRGEITDYDESLRRRVALLQGLGIDALEAVYEQRLRLSPGAQTLVSRAHDAGLKILLVSGGFTFFTDRLRDRLALDFVRSNQLEVADGRLTGRVLGEIVNATVKRRVVQETCHRLGCDPAEAIVVGDGANDLLMMEIAGMSVAYHAKPVVRAKTTHAVTYGGLDSILAFFER